MRNLKRETESLLKAAQNNVIRTNYIKARIDKTQQNSKCRLCGDGNETINHIISECSKLAQKEYKCKHDWVGKVIHWEMCKTFKFEHTNKWYMHNPAPVLENDTHKLLRDFDIHTDNLMQTRPYNNKKKRVCKIVETCCHSAPVKNYQLTLMWKTLMNNNNNNNNNNNKIQTTLKRK